MSRRDDRARLEAEAFAAQLVSCPDCGSICRTFRGLGSTGEVYDLNPGFIPTEHLPEWFVRATLTQGMGVTRGGIHRCPPTFAELTPEETARP